MTDEELATIIDHGIANSVGYYSGKLADQRREAMEYYLGEPFGNEVEGRSQVVSRDVADTVEWIMPSLMKIFCGGDEIVRFDPQGPEDEESARQATDYINYLFTRQNNGFVTLYSLFKDALVQKNGFTKVYWENYTHRKVETYSSLTPDELTMLMQELEQQGNSVEVRSQEQDEQGNYTVKLVIINKKGKACVDPVPPDEVLVAKNSTWDLQKARFAAHQCRKTASDLREMGFDPDGLSEEDPNAFGLERQTRFLTEQEDVFDYDDNLDESTKLFTVTEAYPLVDFDGDGIAERRIVIKVGGKILYNEEIDRVPLETCTPILMPHKLYGLSIADLVMDLQALKSSILRNILDNMYLTNNSRMMVLDGMANIDDLLTVRPGGLVRVKTFDAVKPLQVPFFGAPAFTMLEYIDTVRENRTGVTRYNQGLDANSLNKTATGINNIMSAAQQRIELIARIFAETGVKNIMWALFELVCKHEKRERIVRLRNQWVKIDPRTWTNKFDMSVTVGLGTGNKDQLLQGGSLLLQIQKELAAAGLMGRVVDEKCIYNLSHDMAEAVFPKKADKYFIDPEKQPPAEPKPDPEMEKIALAREKAHMQDQTKRDTKAVDLLLQVAQMQQGGEQQEAQMQAQADERESARADQWGQRQHERAQQDEQRAHERGMRLMDHEAQREMGAAQQGHERTMQAETPEAKAAVDTSQLVSAVSDMMKQVAESQAALAQSLEQVGKALAARKRLVMDANGEPVGVEPVMEQ